MRKVRQLPGARLSPETLLAQVLEDAKAGRVTSVVISIERPDGTFDTCHSNQDNAVLLCHATVIGDVARRCFMGDDPEFAVSCGTDPA